MTSEKMQPLPLRPVGGVMMVVARVSGNEWSVELLRGLAALMVMYAHYYALAGLDRNLFAFFFTGVDLFFVISGFVFAPYFFGKELAWRAFLIRRVFRIYPLYVAALCLYALQRWVSGQEVEHFLTHLFFLHTMQTREIAFHFNPAFWSLPPEVEFYLALPLLCGLFAGVRGVARLWVLALAVHLALVWGMGEAEGRGRAVLEIVLLHLPGLLVEFAFGIVAWRVVAARPGGMLRLLLAVAGVALWWELAGIYREGGDAAIDATWWLHGNLGVWAATAYALMLTALVGLVTEPLQCLRVFAIGLGNLSFGVYLFHNLMPSAFAPWRDGVPDAVFALGCVAATLCLAWGMHRYFEGPAREFGRALAARSKGAVQ
jgi:peptidoglycan/LPS O-acetylase OafA/YrhL